MSAAASRSKYQRGARCIYRDLTARDIDRIIENYADLLAALKAVVGHGYCEASSIAAGQDYVSKKAIAQVRAAIAKAEGR
jgi:hypothetical protein